MSAVAPVPGWCRGAVACTYVPRQGNGLCAHAIKGLSLSVIKEGYAEPCILIKLATHIHMPDCLTCSGVMFAGLRAAPCAACSADSEGVSIPIPPSAGVAALKNPGVIPGVAPGPGVAPTAGVISQRERLPPSPAAGVSAPALALAGVGSSQRLRRGVGPVPVPVPGVASHLLLAAGVASAPLAEGVASQRLAAGVASAPPRPGVASHREPDAVGPESETSHSLRGFFALQEGHMGEGEHHVQTDLHICMCTLWYACKLQWGRVTCARETVRMLEICECILHGKDSPLTALAACPGA